MASRYPIAGKMHHFALRLRMIPRSLGLFWRATEGRLAWWIGLLVVQGLLPAAVVALTRLSAERLGGLLQLAPPRGFSPLIGPLMGLAAAMVFSRLLQAVTEYLSTVQGEQAQDYISDLIHRKGLAVDLAFYEWPEFYDHLHRAQIEARYRPVMLISSLGALLQAGITLVAMAAILALYGWWLPALLIISAIPPFVCFVQQAQKKFLFRQRTTGEERRADYYSQLMTSGDAAAELRLFGLADHFVDAWRDIRHRLRSQLNAFNARDALVRGIAALGGFAIAGTAGLWILWRTLQGVATVADLVLFYQAFFYGQQLIHTLLQQIGQLYYNTIFLGSLFEFLALEPSIASPPSPATVSRVSAAEYRFESVTFSYPYSERRILENFDLALPQGKLTALVGPNGAGKSTLVKLLCRFYDPVGGRVTRENVDLKDVSLEDLRARVTVLFQRPLQFNTTVQDNIALGNVAASPTAEQVRAAAEAAGADQLIGRLPRGYEQMLGHGFARGVELSGGEWQRVALARAFVRDAELIILDEPTSAMDPWAESEWLARFRSLARGKTVLLITHRFTSARHADMIHVMVDGRIEESGSHDALVAAGGKYAQSWNIQVRDVIRSEAERAEAGNPNRGLPPLTPLREARG